MELKDGHVAQLDLTDGLRDALDHARGLGSAGARRREERRVASEVRDQGVDEVLAAIDDALEKDRADARAFRVIEDLRNRLRDGDDSGLDDLRARGLDDAPLRPLIEETRQEAKTGKPKGAGRRLFRHLRDALATLDAADAADDDHTPDELDAHAVSAPPEGER